jgi:hypothetical protein
MNILFFCSPTYDLRFKPELVAPGEWIISAKSNGQMNENNCLHCDTSLMALHGTR